MSDSSPKRGLTFPFFASLVLFVLLLADRWLGETFVPSPAWRSQQPILLGIAIVALLWWFWLLAAARRRDAHFEGPIQTVRGRAGVLQPLLGTIFLVVIVNLAWQTSLPKWANAVVAERMASAVLTPTSPVTAARFGCNRIEAESAKLGPVYVCLPERVAGRLAASPGTSLTITGPASWFGIQAERYDIGLQSSTARRFDPAGGLTRIGKVSK